MTIAELDALPPSLARVSLERCCGARRWIDYMIDNRPFRSLESLHSASESAWAACTESDRREAFTHHPRIGDVDDLARRFASTHEWASGEQRGVEGAEREVLERLAQGNQMYEAHFGYRFIVCATGLSALQMVELLEARMSNDAATELMIASNEQHRITRIRLEKLLT